MKSVHLCLPKQVPTLLDADLLRVQYRLTKTSSYESFRVLRCYTASMWLLCDISVINPGTSNLKFKVDTFNSVQRPYWGNSKENVTVLMLGALYLEVPPYLEGQGLCHSLCLMGASLHK